MARGRSVIVGGGLGTAGLLSLGGILTVANINPPNAQVASQATASVTTYPRAAHVILSDGVTLGGTAVLASGGLFAGNGVEYTADTNTALSPVILGNAAIARGIGGIMSLGVIVGGGATAIAAGGIAGFTVVGGGASYTGSGPGVVIGNSAAGTSQFITIVGAASSITGVSSNSVVIGCQSTLSGQRNTSLGDGTTNTGGNDNVVIGQGSTISGGALRSIVIVGSNANFSDSISISATAWQANTLTIGSGTTSITTVLIGKGNTSATPATVMYRNTNGVGSDIAGGAIVIQTGLSTGVAVPPVIQFNLGGQGTTGAVLQTAFAAFKLSHTTAAGMFATFDTAVAGNIVSLRLSQAQVQKAVVGVAGAANDLIATSAAGDLCIRSEANVIRFSTDAGVSDAMDLSTAGILNFNKDRAVRFNNATTSAGAAAGTLGNAPTAGNPGFWLKINIAGTNYAIPCWLG